jgi:hypothetical protein
VQRLSESDYESCTEGEESSADGGGGGVDVALDVRHMQLPIRPSSMPAGKVTFSQLWLVSYAGRWKGGQLL